MARLKHSRAKRLVLDIGSSAIRLCELSQTKAGYQLTKYYQREFLIDPAMSEDEKKKVQSDALLALVKEAKVRTRRTIFGVPGQSVFVRNRALPPVPEYKVTQIVRYEIQQQIPFGLDQIALDYQVLNRTEAGGYDVLMAAIKVDVVDKRIELIRTAKCRVDTVDVCPMAAYNWMKHTGEFGNQGECIALLDLGAATTDIVIERDNQFRFTRSLNLGGNDVTAAISNGFGVGFAEAEKLKRERGFAPTGDPQVDGRAGEVIGQILNRLVSEVTRSLAYFRSQPGGGPVSRVIVTGGGACLRNMIPFLQRQLGVEVRIAQPLSGLAIAPGAQEVSEHPEQACVALGLALRGNETVPIEINLIPPRIIEAARHREQALYWALTFVILMFIMATIIPDNAQKNELVLKQMQMVKTAIQQYDPAIFTASPDKPGPSKWEGALAKAKGDLSSLKNTVASLDQYYGDKAKFLDKLKAVNDARPETNKSVWFSSVESTHIGADAGSAASSVRAAPAAPATGSGSRGGFGALSMGAGFSAGPAGAGSGLASSSGFPGLTPSISRSGAPGRMGGMGASAGMGRPGAAAGPEPEPEAPQDPNGFIIHGYGYDPDTIKQFVDRLKEGQQFIEGGVYFDEASMVRRPVSVLNNAEVAAVPAAGGVGGGFGGSSDDEEDGERGRGFGGGGSARSYGGGAGPGASGVASVNEANVTSFVVQVQYAGTKVDPAALTPPQAGVRGAATGRSGGSLRRNKDG